MTINDHCGLKKGGGGKVDRGGREEWVIQGW